MSTLLVFLCFFQPAGFWAEETVLPKFPSAPHLQGSPLQSSFQGVAGVPFSSTNLIKLFPCLLLLFLSRTSKVPAGSLPCGSGQTHLPLALPDTLGCISKQLRAPERLALSLTSGLCRSSSLCLERTVPHRPPGLPCPSSRIPAMSWPRPPQVPRGAAIASSAMPTIWCHARRGGGCRSPHRTRSPFFHTAEPVSSAGARLVRMRSSPVRTRAHKSKFQPVARS